MAKDFLVGNIPQEAISLLERYLSETGFGMEFEMLGASKSRHMLTSYCKTSGSVGIILSQLEYNEAKSYNIQGDEILYCYSDIKSFEEYLTSQFGGGVVSSDADTDFSMDISDPYAEVNKSYHQVPQQPQNSQPQQPQYIPQSPQPQYTQPPVQVVDNSLQLEVDKLRVELQRLSSDLSNSNARYNTAQSELIDIKGKYSEAKQELELALTTKTVSDVDLTAESEEEITRLKNELVVLREQNYTMSGKASQLDSILANNDKISDELRQKHYEIKTKEQEIARLGEEILISKGEVSKIAVERENMETQLEGVLSEKSALEETISKLQADITNKDTILKKSEVLFRKQRQETEELRSKLKDSGAELVTKNQDLNTKVSNLESLNASLHQQLQQLSLLKDERTDVDGQIEQLNTQISDLTGKLGNKDSEMANVIKERDTLTMELNNVKLDLDSLNSDIVVLNQTISNQKSEIERLTISATSDSDAILEVRAQLATEISAKGTAEAEIVRLTREIEVEHSKYTQVCSDLEQSRSDLSVFNIERANEVATLQRQIASLGVAQQEAGNVALLRQHNQSLELDIQEKVSQLRDIKSDIFNRLGSSAIPAGAVTHRVTVPRGLPPERFFCVASGSGESNLRTMECLRDSIMLNSNINYMIVDISLDSRIDVDFGLSGVKSPKEWLQGNKSFTEYLVRPSRQQIYNLTVLSTAFSYMNDLFLLRVDWAARLRELENSADIIIINLGCLNSIVTKTLYASFSDIMRSHIIVKSTPFNMRSTALNIAGFKEMPTTTITCLDYEDNTSADWYSRLGKKCNIRVLGRGQAITL